jgi:hypothetical protein
VSRDTSVRRVRHRAHATPKRVACDYLTIARITARGLSGRRRVQSIYNVPYIDIKPPLLPPNSSKIHVIMSYGAENRRILAPRLMITGILMDKSALIDGRITVDCSEWATSSIEDQSIMNYRAERPVDHELRAGKAVDHEPRGPKNPPIMNSSS